MALDSYDTFEAVKGRLDEIVDAVSSDDLSLDDALALYEEAVGLGLRASDLLEEDIEAQRAEEEEGAAEGAKAAERGEALDGDEAAGSAAGSHDVSSVGRPAEAGPSTCCEASKPASAQPW